MGVSPPSHAGHDLLHPASDHTRLEEEERLNDQITPQLPEGVHSSSPRSPASFGDSSGEERVSFQAEHQGHGLDEGDDHDDGRDHSIGHASEASRFSNGSDYRPVTWTHAPPVCEREGTRTRRLVMLAMRS